jgi:leucyl/phenylalanyl-tRNA---protein transferase
VPRSFQKWLRHNQYKFEITQNQAFAEVMHECRQQKREGQKGSWITNQIEKNYQKLFESGGAFSLEVWREKNLVGGIYGVKSEKYYSCESMFHKEDNTSKLALYSLVQLLKKQGHTWMDIQMVTSVCESFGGKLIQKNEFLARIGFVLD